MALKLSKAEFVERDKLNKAMQESASALAGVVDDYNLTMLDAWKEVEEALTDFNTKREAAIQWAHDISSRIEDECVGKSEKWLESARGENALSFQGDYEKFYIVEVEIDQPDELQAPELPEDVFEGLPEEVE
jgi:hypothetical protein